MNQTSCCPPLSQAVDRETAEDLATGLKALADPTRLQIVSIIAGATTDEICACDLPELLGRTQSTISHHLGQLVDAGILDREMRGKWAWFTLRRDRMAQFAAALTT